MNVIYICVTFNPGFLSDPYAYIFQLLYDFCLINICSGFCCCNDSTYESVLIHYIWPYHIVFPPRSTYVRTTFAMVSFQYACDPSSTFILILICICSNSIVVSFSVNHMYNYYYLFCSHISIWITSVWIHVYQYTFIFLCFYCGLILINIHGLHSYYGSMFISTHGISIFAMVSSWLKRPYLFFFPAQLAYADPCCFELLWFIYILFQL